MVENKKQFDVERLKASLEKEVQFLKNEIGKTESTLERQNAELQGLFKAMDVVARQEMDVVACQEMDVKKSGGL